MANRARHVTDVLFVLSLFCVFAVSSLLVAVIGAKAYSSSLDRMDSAFDSRTTLSYIANKIHEYDTAGSIYLSDIDGVNALVIEESINDRIYKTYIYHYDGYLMELFISPDSEVSIDIGQKLIPVYSLEMESDGEGLFRFGCQDKNGKVTDMFISLRTDSGTL